MKARAWMIQRPGPIEGRPLVRGTIELAEPGPGEVLLRVLACGVCRTDLHEVNAALAALKAGAFSGAAVLTP